MSGHWLRARNNAAGRLSTHPQQLSVKKLSDKGMPVADRWGHNVHALVVVLGKEHERQPQQELEEQRRLQQEV
jgi:hypothetical protein